MLRRICNKCGSVIDGEPVVGKEYADAVVVIDDEIAAYYEDLCDRCKHRLLDMFKGNPHPEPSVQPIKEPEQDETEPEPQETTAAPEPEQHMMRQHVPYDAVDKDELPNQVTKQFPIKLNLPSSGA